MNNHDILRRIRYVFDFNDTKLIALFQMGGQRVTQAQVSEWLNAKDETDTELCSDTYLAAFLNGLIVEKRGKKEGVDPLQERLPETVLTNNSILMKLKIALDLKAEDMLAILSLAKVNISKHELSALFRKPGHKHYRECMDQFLRNFLAGLALQYR
ncbi:DUF1456 family protein [Simiduia curdlanivorans]|uniref:DUF1456 family protein n=1 Tax=Simiduia curdlanivorans TaxID=1492769 RepID=A0ABV8UYY3_9GAMM|nr:DUF1456 family protein [Simiduia curdlanivorans]MDN3640507.1 DUF1456 family protein [Simiduia curdlanivorans]